MKLHDPAFEARLRARVRPHWKAAIKKHGPVGPSVWSRHRNVSGLSGFVLALMGSGLLRNLVRHHWSPRAIAAYAGLACTLFCVMISGMVRAEIGRPKDLLTLLWWPAPDELIGRWGWQALQRFRRRAFFPLLFLLTALAFDLGESPEWPWLPALLLAAALGAIAAAGAVVLPLPRRAMQLAALLLVCMIALLIVQPLLLMQRLGAWFDQTADLLTWLHPGGWLIGVLRAALHPQSWSFEWLLIVPLLALAEGTRFWRRRFCAAVNSAALLEQIETTAVRDVWAPEETPPIGMEDLAPAASHAEEPADAAATPAPDRQALRDQWRAVLPPLSFEGRFQQWLRARLTAREVLLCEAMGLALPSWQQVTGWLWKFCAAAWALAWLGRALHWTDGGMLVAIVGVVLFTGTRIVIYATASPASVLSVWMPIGYAEIRRLEWKRGWPILLLMTPWLVLTSCAIGWLQDFSLAWSALVGLKLAVLAAGVHPWLVVCKYSATSGDTTGWRWSSARIFANFTLAGLATCGGLGGACLPGWRGWALIAVAIAATWRLYAVHRRQWDRRRFDVGPGAAG